MTSPWNLQERWPTYVRRVVSTILQADGISDPWVCRDLLERACTDPVLRHVLARGYAIGQSVFACSMVLKPLIEAADNVEGQTVEEAETIPIGTEKP